MRDTAVIVEQEHRRRGSPGLEVTPAVSVVVPAYNEEQGISRVLNQVHKAMGGAGWEYELLVVDDGSTDATASVVQHAGDVRLLRHPANRGYGAALKTGIRHARHPLIAITDADGTYPSDRLPELVRTVASGEADMAVGGRIGENVAIPHLRRPAKWVLKRLAELAAGERIPDLNSGLRVFTREAALRMFGLLPSGFSFTTTITLAMLSNGYIVTYTPIDYGRRTGRSKVRPLHDTGNFVTLILKIALYFAPLKVFLPASAVLFLASLATGLYTWLVVGRVADVTTVVLFLSAVQIGAIGLLSELINRRTPNVYREEP